MGSATEPVEYSEALRQHEQLRAQLAAMRQDVDRLQARVQQSVDRADASDARAEASEARADEDRRAADEQRSQADADRLRIDNLEEQVDVDRQLIMVLRSEGVLKDEQVANLEIALATSRRIGAAIGLVIAAFKVSEAAAFAMLRMESQNTNRRLRAVADEIVMTGEASGLTPPPRRPDEA